jgi:acyl dehydratase
VSIEAAKAVGLDLSDVQRRVGQWIGGGDLYEPCTALDIRRWVQAMDYANPVHWDEAFAQRSKFGGIIAPQSFVGAVDYGHSGMLTAVVGHVPDAHMIAGGEEWWYTGYRIRPGDKVEQKRRFDGFTVKETAFAGPTAFTRGDTFHTTTAGAPVAHCRCTAIRYSAVEADKRGVFKQKASERKVWTKKELAEVSKLRTAWILSNREGRTPRIGDVKVGDKLPRRALGPHSIASFVSEWRAFAFQAWGASQAVAPEGVEDPWVNNDPGTLKGMELDTKGGEIDPRLLDGLYSGPASVHVNAERAGEAGMGRAFGYGASIGAWFADYVSYWAGHDGALRHTKLSLKNPAFEGDVTYIDGEITAVEPFSPHYGVPMVTIRVVITNHDGAAMVDGFADVEIGF